MIQAALCVMCVVLFASIHHKGGPFPMMYWDTLQYVTLDTLEPEVILVLYVPET